MTWLDQDGHVRLGAMVNFLHYNREVRGSIFGNNLSVCKGKVTYI